MQVLDEDTKLHVFLIYNVQYLVKHSNNYQDDQKLLATLQQFMGTTLSFEHIRSKLLAKYHLCENLRIVASRFNHMLGKLPLLPYNPYIDLVSGHCGRLRTVSLIAEFSCKYLAKEGGLELIKFSALEKFELSSLVIEQYIHFRHLWENFKLQVSPFRAQAVNQPLSEQQADTHGLSRPQTLLQICSQSTGGLVAGECSESKVAVDKNSISRSRQFLEARDQTFLENLVRSSERTIDNHEKLLAGAAVHLLPNIESLDFARSRELHLRADKKRQGSAPF